MTTQEGCHRVTITELAKEEGVSVRTVKRADHYTAAIDQIAAVVGLPPLEVCRLRIAPMNRMADIASMPAERIREIVARAQRGEDVRALLPKREAPRRNWLAEAKRVCARLTLDEWYELLDSWEPAAAAAA